jgi:nicotinamide-nucleotide adenylyltransferase
MMVLLARELQEQSADRGSPNIAVAVCQEPTFVGKSAALKPFFHERMISLSSSAHVRLTFLIGFDTLERLFAPRYYGSEALMKDALGRFFSTSGDDSRVICARRTSGASYSQVDSTVLDAAAEYINSGAVALVDIGEEVRTLSSSEIRDMVRNVSNAWQRKVPSLVAAYIKENSLYAQFDRLN